MDRTLQMVLLIILVLLLLGLMPVWPYAGAWGLGWYPSGTIALLVIVLVIAAVLGGRGTPSPRL